MMHQKKGLVYVWPLCTRIIHWMIASSFLLSFITAFFHHYFIWHIAFGYVFGIALCFRLLWGFIGPDYATFAMFTLNFSALRLYFAEKIGNRWRKIHPGHNAASSWFTLIVLALGLSIVISGVMVYGTQEGSGLLASWNKEYYTMSFWLEPLHYVLSCLLVVWVVIHIVGVLIEQFYHRTNMVFAMISGYKRSEGDDTLISPWQSILTYSVVLFSTYLFFAIVLEQDTMLTKSSFEKREYHLENPAFDEKCSKCHKNYPPFMLPKASWEKLMEGLSNHFGEEILEHNISMREQGSIKAYLMSHSAETSTHKVAFKTLASLGEMRPLSITKSPYWREAHARFDNSLFKHPLVKDRSNCFACHRHFEYGLFDNSFIHLP